MDEYNQPVQYATATLTRPKTGEIVKGEISDEKGEFVIQKVARGEYVLSVSMVGYKRFESDSVKVDGRNDIIEKKIVLNEQTEELKAVEVVAKKDFIHHRASGLNQVLCKSANENDVIIGFSLRSVLNAENKSLILGRIMQNISICRKFKAKTAIASFAQKPFEMRSVHDVISLFEVLGCKNPAFLKDSDIS